MVTRFMRFAVVALALATATAGFVAPAGASGNVPSAPLSPSAVPGNASATVSWSVPASTGGSPITGYVVTPYLGAVAQSPQAFNSTAASETVTGLTNATSVTFRVAAVNTFGTGPQSVSTPTAIVVGAPSAPVSPVAIPGNGSATVSWSVPASSGGSPITGYVVTPYAGTVAQSPQTFNSTADTETAVGLTNGTMYSFRVSAVNSRGLGPAASTTAAAIVAGAPTPVRSVSVVGGTGTVTASWVAPVSANGSPITGYVVTTYVPSGGYLLFGFPTSFGPGATSGTINGLTTGATYVLSVVAINSRGSSPRVLSDPVVPSGMSPSAPLSPSAVAGIGSATVSWSPPAATGGSPVTGYVVTPYINGVAQSALTFTSDSLSESLTGLTNGTSYTFVVAAINVAGPGAQSVPTAPVVVGGPSAPLSPAAVPGSGSATVSWSAPTSPGGSAITAYVVTPYVGAVAQSTQTFDTAALTETAVGLTNGTTYTFRVAAVNGFGTGPQSAATAPVIVGTPSAPVSPLAVPGDGAATVSWSVPASSGGSPITGYVVTPFIGGVAQPAQTFNSTVLTATAVGLGNGSTYAFRVSAVNSRGLGPAAATSPIVVGAPTSVRSVSAVPGNGSVTVSWAAPVSANGASITGYVVTTYVPGGGYLLFGFPTSFSPGVTTGTINGLSAAASYVLSVVATNSRGSSPRVLTNPVVPSGTTPSAPLSPTAVPGIGSANLSWSAPASTGGSPVSGYVVTPYVNGVAQSPQTFASNALSEPISGLADGTSYIFRVAAMNGVGTGTQSVPTASVLVGGPTAPLSPLAVPGNSSAMVSWVAPVSVNGSPITGYVVTPYVGAVAQSAQTFNSAALAETVVGLTNGTAYTFRVAAVNGFGTGQQSVSTPFAILVGTPSPPVSASAVPGIGSAVVSWSTPVSTGDSPITGYVVTPYVGTAALSALTFNSAALTETVVGLTNGTTYTFRVAAMNARGVGPATTTAPPIVVGAPTPVRSVSVVAGDSSATLSWVAPVSENGSSITGYVVTTYVPAGGYLLFGFPTSFGPSTTSGTINGLAPGGTYVFAVVAVNGRGNSPRVLTNPFVAVIAPSPPVSPSAVPGNRSATVSWSVPASTGGSPITGYVVTPYINGVVQSPQAFNSAALTETVIGLTNGTTYTFGVAAVNAVGAGIQSDLSDPIVVGP